MLMNWPVSKSRSSFTTILVIAFLLTTVSAGNCKDNLDGYPDETFGEFVNIAGAAYANAPINYLSQYSNLNWASCGRTKKTSSDWQVTCLKDKTNKRFYITFRGVTDAQWGYCGIGGVAGLAGCSAGFVGTAEKASTVRNFKRWIKDRWQEQRQYGYKFFAIVGHSMGGYFATRVLKGEGYQIWRITFNAWKATASPYTINLRGKKDGLSGQKDCRYFKVNGVSGHGLKEFIDVKHKSWQVIVRDDWTTEHLPADNTPEDRALADLPAIRQLFVDEELARTSVKDGSYFVFEVIVVLMAFVGFVYLHLRRSKRAAVSYEEVADDVVLTVG